MSIDFAPSFGLERLGRNALMSLMDGLNAEISAQMSSWAPLDAELAASKNIRYTPVKIEHIDPENFHLGHRPSLLEAPREAYPNVSVMAYEAEPSSDVSFDQDIESWEGRLFVEVMVKAEKDGDLEELVNSRIQRTADAVNNVLTRDRTLGGAFPGLRSPGRVTVTDVFVRREEKGKGPKFLWQMARLEYSFTKYANY